MDTQQLHYHNAVEIDVEFWPVEHPMEPLEENRPVKCPIPTSLLNDGRVGEERSAESLKKRAVVNLDAAGPHPQAVRKRHHTLTNGDHIIMPLTRRMPFFPSQ